VVGLASERWAVAVVDDAAHAVNFSHPEALAGLIEMWLDDALDDVTRLPDGVRVVATTEH
jgi:hypothetical protein